MIDLSQLLIEVIVFAVLILGLLVYRSILKK